MANVGINQKAITLDPASHMQKDGKWVSLKNVSVRSFRFGMPLTMETCCD
jgi:hypothetical protein